MKTVFQSIQASLLIGLGLILTGCGQRADAPPADEAGKKADPAKAHHAPEAGKHEESGKPDAKTAKEKKIEAARAKLDPADRALVEEQDYCPVMPKQKLGSMGMPIKVMVKGQPVFLCCKGCKATAEEEPDETLKALADLKAKSKK